MVNLDLAASTGSGKDTIACHTPSEAGSRGHVSAVAVVWLAGPTGVPHEPASTSHCPNGQGVSVGPVRRYKRRPWTIKTHDWKPGLQVVETDSSFLLGHHHLGDE